MLQGRGGWGGSTPDPEAGLWVSGVSLEESERCEFGGGNKLPIPLSGADPAWSADRGSWLRRPGQSRGSSRKTWAFFTSGPVG